ncbi:MAG TPA: NADP oxidoreductase, partial [Thermoleophilia bacterium]|nr:NADP oxidoreductase [Thermoleophilia bacterium]
VMVDPAQLGEETDQFVAGDDPDAKAWVSEHLLRAWLGWTRVRDLGDISAARALEMYLPLWLRLLTATGSASLNVRVVVAGEAG